MKARNGRFFVFFRKKGREAPGADAAYTKNGSKTGAPRCLTRIETEPDRDFSKKASRVYAQGTVKTNIFLLYLEG